MDNKTNKKTLLSKQKAVIIILAVLAVVLGVAYGIVSGIKGDYGVVLPLYDEQGDLLEYTYTSESGEKVTLVSKDDTSITLDADSKITYSSRPFIYPEIPVESISEIKVENLRGEFSLYLDKNSGEHLIRGNEMQLYNNQQISDLRFQARYALAIMKVDGVYETEDELSAFGLDSTSNPVKMTVTSTSGESNTVLIGDMLITGAAYYAKTADKPYVYVVDTSVSVFFSSKNDFINPIVTKPMSQNEYQYADEFCINRNGEPFLHSKIVPEERRTQTSDTSLHKITYPANYPAAMTNYYNSLACFANLSGTSVVETNLSQKTEEEVDEIFAGYGLDNPTNDVVCIYQGKEYRFITGNKFTDETGSVAYYTYSPYMDTIVVLPLANAPFLEYELMDFIDLGIFQVNIKNVSEITVHTPGRSCRFVLDGSGENLKVTEANSGKVIDTASFRQFYISLLNVKIEGYATAADVTGDNEFGFSVTSVFGEKNSYEFSIISTTRDLITLDGNSQFYTNRSFITKAAERLDKLMNGEIITPDY